MGILLGLFPLSFRLAKTVANLIVGILIYLVIGIVGGAILSIIGILSIIPVIGWILAALLGLVGALLDLYCLAAIIVLVLVFCKVLK